MENQSSVMSFSLNITFQFYKSKSFACHGSVCRSQLCQFAYRGMTKTKQSHLPWWKEWLEVELLSDSNTSLLLFLSLGPFLFIVVFCPDRQKLSLAVVTIFCLSFCIILPWAGGWIWYREKEGLWFVIMSQSLRHSGPQKCHWFVLFAFPGQFRQLCSVMHSPTSTEQLMC